MCAERDDDGSVRIARLFARSQTSRARLFTWVKTREHSCVDERRVDAPKTHVVTEGGTDRATSYVPRTRTRMVLPARALPPL